MPEEQARFSIEKQEAGRDIYQAGRDIIIQHPLTQEPINIPSIQSVLRKGETTDGNFFKKEPEWVDYEQGFIVERKEVDEIIKKLDTTKVQLVLGAPASGKSIILKNVGFKLANENKNVYVVELKKHPQDEIKLFFENIPKIDEDNPIFIIDDAHLYFSYCERLAKDFKSRGKGNLIIGSRETREITEGEEKEASEFEYLRKTAVHILAEDLTEEMIMKFLKVKHQFDDERIQTVSYNLEIYKQDLWFLSWALKTYNPEKNLVEEKEIFKKIKRDSIEKIKIGKDENEKPIVINAENVLLPLSIFYRFEIPIERYFLEEQMGIKGNIINQLVEIQEIMEKEEIGRHKMLSLNHSSIAKLYFGAYQNFPDLGKRTKEIILKGKDEENLEFCSFHRYITTTDPRNSIDVIISLDRDYFDEEGGKKLLKNLIKEEKIQKSIENGINKEQDIRKVCGFVSSIEGVINTELAMKLTDSISAKIDKEEHIGKVGWCLSDIEGSSAATKVVYRIDIHAMSLKIDKEQDIGNVSLCVSEIAEANKEIATKLLDRIDIHALSAKIDREEDIAKVGLCIYHIERANKEVATKLLDRIDIHAMSLKIDDEQDIGNVSLCVSNIARANKEVATKLLDRIDIHALSSKIDREEDIGKIGWYLSGIEREFATKLVDSIDIQTLSSKINREEDIGKIGSCVSGLASANKEVAMNFVDSIKAKIDREEVIGKVGSCVKRIAWANQEVAMKMVQSIDIDNLSLKIYKEEDIRKVGWCVSDIAWASQKVAMKFVESIKTKIEIEEDIGKVGSCVSGLAMVSKEVALKLVDSVLARINKEENIGNVESCVSDIARASKEVANEIISRLNPKLREELQKKDGISQTPKVSLVR